MFVLWGEKNYFSVFLLIYLGSAHEVCPFLHLSLILSYCFNFSLQTDHCNHKDYFLRHFVVIPLTFSKLCNSSSLGLSSDGSKCCLRLFVFRSTRMRLARWWLCRWVCDQRNEWFGFLGQFVCLVLKYLLFFVSGQLRTMFIQRGFADSQSCWLSYRSCYQLILALR